MIASRPRCRSVIKPGRALRKNGFVTGGRWGADTEHGRIASGAVIRHLLHARRLCQLLGGDASERAENLFSLFDGKGHPKPPGFRAMAYLRTARGGTTAD